MTDHATLRAILEVRPVELYRVAASLDGLATDLRGALATCRPADALPTGPGEDPMAGALGTVLTATERTGDDIAAAYRDGAARIRSAARAYETADGG